jgi:hypothetical protein
MYRPSLWGIGGIGAYIRNTTWQARGQVDDVSNALTSMLHCKHPARVEFRALLSGGAEHMELVNA